MFDTIVGSISSLPISSSALESILLGGLNDRYVCKRISIPYAKASQAKHAYLLLLKFSSVEDRKKYFLIKMRPRPDLVGIPQLKVKTEISHFKDGVDFINDFEGLIHSPWWEFIVQNHKVTTIHPKCDFYRIEFNSFKTSLDFPYPRNPELLKNTLTGARTLYVSPNHYYYEKQGKVRGERRIVGSEIFDKFNVYRFQDINKVSINQFLRLFSSVKFINPYKITRKISDKDYRIYQHFLAILHYKEESIKTGRRGSYIVSNDFFLNAKLTASKCSNRRFNRNVFPVLEELNLWPNGELISEYNNFMRINR